MSDNVYQVQFQNIRDNARAELTKLSTNHLSLMQDTVIKCLSAVVEERTIIKEYCSHILETLRCTDHDKILNATAHNAVFAIDKMNVMVTFDINDTVTSVSFMNHVVVKNAMDMKLYEVLLSKLKNVMNIEMPSHLSMRFEQTKAQRQSMMKQLAESKQRVHETIRARLCTIYDLEIGLSFYTLNYSEDMSMLFWDRYTIVNETAKSFYIEQHCIVENLIKGEVDPERFIMDHKPSKNNVPMFLADRFAGLTEMQRPKPRDFEPQAEPYRVQYDIED